MDIVAFREFCLGLGDVTEKMPFGKFAARYDSILAFYVEGHMFCFVDIDDFTWINVKSTPDEVSALREKYASVCNPVNMSPKYWVQIEFHGDVPQEEIMRLVGLAYSIVKEKYRKKRQKRTSD